MARAMHAILFGVFALGAVHASAQTTHGGRVYRLGYLSQPTRASVEQPTKFELVLNLQTAKALGLVIPASVLQRADELIQ
jgi:putative ABC transport system substrate-binding protein